MHADWPVKVGPSFLKDYLVPPAWLFLRQKLKLKWRQRNFRRNVENNQNSCNVLSFWFSGSVNVQRVWLVNIANPVTCQNAHNFLFLGTFWCFIPLSHRLQRSRLSWLFAEVINPCTTPSNPCHNDGVCTPSADGQVFELFPSALTKVEKGLHDRFSEWHSVFHLAVLLCLFWRLVRTHLHIKYVELFLLSKFFASICLFFSSWDICAFVARRALVFQETIVTRTLVRTMRRVPWWTLSLCAHAHRQIGSMGPGVKSVNVFSSRPDLTTGQFAGILNETNGEICHLGGKKKSALFPGSLWLLSDMMPCESNPCNASTTASCQNVIPAPGTFVATCVCEPGYGGATCSECTWLRRFVV